MLLLLLLSVWQKQDLFSLLPPVVVVFAVAAAVAAIAIVYQ